jgi:hypothetical protein
VIYERPSRTSRALVFVSALLVAALAGWMLAPIVQAQYPSAIAAVPLLRDLIGRDSAVEPQPMAEPSPEPVPIVEIARESAPGPDTPAGEAMAPSADMPADATASRSAPAAFANAPQDVPLASNAPAGLLPWPGTDATTSPGEPPVTTEETTAAIDAAPLDAALVPLPRARPFASGVARAGVPVPRPRPDTAPVEEEAGPSAEDMLLFDRLSRPN